jgi:hypothetical protein
MSSSPTVKLSGLAVVSGAVVVFVTALLGALLFVGNDPSAYANDGLYVPVNVLGFLGFAVLLVGFPAIFVAWEGKVGALGVIGLCLIFLTGLMFGVFFTLMAAVLIPYLTQHAPNLLKGSNGPPALFVFFIAGSLAQVVGCVLLAIQILRGLASQRWVGVVLVLSAVMQVVSFFTGGSSSNVLQSLISNLGELLILVALAGIGYELWSQTPAAAPLRTGSATQLPG